MRRCLSVGVVALSLTALGWNARYWIGGEGDFTDAAMWKSGLVPSGVNDIANLSKVSGQTSACARIGEGMCITNAYFHLARTANCDLVQSGGTLVVTSTDTSDPGFKVGRGDTDKAASTAITGVYTLSGGRVDVPKTTVAVGYYGTGTLNLAGGDLTAAKRVTLSWSANGHGTIRLGAGSTLTAPSVYLAHAGTATFIFDGGVLAAAGSGTSDNLLSGVEGTSARVDNGGAKIDVPSGSQEVDIPLQAVEGATGGLEKLGAGILVLSAANTYAGTTTVREGKLIAQSPASLPGWREGRVIVKDGAQLVVGTDWTAAEIADLNAALVREGDAPAAGYYIDTSTGDLTLDGDLAFPCGLFKGGANTLYLTGHNTMGGDVVVQGGTLAADFGTGLDAAHAVVLAGGALSSTSGSITAGLGTGAGQVTVLPDAVPAFTAKGVPLTLNFGGQGKALLVGSPTFTNGVLTLNTAEADAPITLQNPVRTTGEFVLAVEKGEATLAGGVSDPAFANGTLKKRGAGTLVANDLDRLYRLTVEAGSVVAAGGGPQQLGIVNLFGGALYATNQTLEARINIDNGALEMKDSTFTTAESFISGWSAGSSTKAKVNRVLLDNTAVSARTFYAGWDGYQRSDFVLTNGATVLVPKTATGDRSLQVGWNATASDCTLEVNAGCSVNVPWMIGTSGRAVQRGGTVAASVSNDSAVRLGTNGRYFDYDLEDGELTSAYAIHMSRAKQGRARFRQSGGVVDAYSTISVGYADGGTGLVHVTAGTMKITGNGKFRVGDNGDGYLEVGGSGVVQTGSSLLSLASDHETASGRAVLSAGGTIEAPAIAGNAERTSEFHFNGGTLVATKASATFIDNLSALTMSPAGGTIDTNGKDVTFAQPLTESSADCGLLRHRWSFDGDCQDSVGGLTGSVTGAVTFVNGAAVLAGGKNGTSYIDLGAGALPADPVPTTIEIWATQQSVQYWSRIFCITSGTTSDRLTASWCAENNAAKDRVFMYADGKSVFGDKNDTLAPYALGKQYHLAFVFEPNYLRSGTTRLTWTKRNAATGEVEARGSAEGADGVLAPGAFLQDHFYLGHSPSSGNYDANAAYDEVRVWAGALSEGQLAAHVLAGPDGLPAAPNALVKTGEGRLTLTGANRYAGATRVLKGTLALAAQASLPSATSVELAEEGVLDLGGAEQTVVDLAGDGTVANGALTATGRILPGGEGQIGSLRFDGAVPAGRFIADVAGASADCLVGADGLLDLSQVTFEVVAEAELQAGKVYPVVRSPAGIRGRFAQTATPSGWSVHYGSDRVTLTRGGLAIIIR